MKIKFNKVKKKYEAKVGVWKTKAGIEFPIKVRRLDEEGELAIKNTKDLNKYKEKKQQKLVIAKNNKVVREVFADRINNADEDNTLLTFWELGEDIAIRQKYLLDKNTIENILHIDFDYKITKSDLEEELKELKKLKRGNKNELEVEEINESISSVNSLIELIDEKKYITWWEFFDCPKDDYLKMANALREANILCEDEDLLELADTVQAIKIGQDVDKYVSEMKIMRQLMKYKVSLNELPEGIRNMMGDLLDKVQGLKGE